MTTERDLFKVLGMYCTNCKPIVEKQLKDEESVKSISIPNAFSHAIAIVFP